MAGLNNPTYPTTPDLSALTVQSDNTTAELNRFMARSILQKPKLPYSVEIVQKIAGDLAGKGYNSAGAAVDVSADVIDGLMNKLVVKGVTRTNWVKSPTMGVDTDADGVVDDFTSVSSANHTVAFALDAATYQKITVSAATDAGVSGVTQTVVPAAPADVFSVSVEGYLASVVAGFKGVLYGEWLDAADTSLANFSIDLTATVRTTVKVENQTAPANTVKLKITLQAVTLASGDTGIVRFKKALIEKSATAGVFIVGTKSTPSQRIKSVGKNLFDRNKAVLNYDIDEASGGLVAWVDRFVSDYIKVSPSIEYTFSYLLRICYFDADKKFISGAMVNSNIPVPITTPASTAYLRFTQKYLNRLDCQMEQGAAATAYEPYADSLCHTFWTWGTGGKAVGTVRDEVDLLTGVAIKRISEWTNIATTVYNSLDNTTYANVDVIKTTAFSTAKAGTSAANGFTYLVNKDGAAMAEVAAADIDNVASVGKYYYHNDKTVWFIVAADAYADIAAARIGLGTSTLVYQLATSVISYSRWYLANAYQNGTIIVEPMLIGTRKPNAVTSKLDITDSTLPASSIEQVLRHDVQTNGVLVETDVTANCTLTDSGTTITITSIDLTKEYTYKALIDSRYNPGCEITSKVPLSCARHDYGAAATAWTLTTDEANAPVLYATNANGAADIIAPTKIGALYTLINASGQTLTIKKSGGTGVALGTGKIAHVGYNGTDYAFVVDSNT